MPRYRIFRLQPERRTAFQEKPPKAPPYRLKPAHYEPAGEIEAPSPYAAWKALQEGDEEQEQEAEGDAPRPLSVGDALESGDSGLLVCNFWGFDRAQWQEQQPGPGVADAPQETLQSSTQASDHPAGSQGAPG